MYAQRGYAQLESHAKNVHAGFSLPAECERAAKILEGFLADPNNPESALNSIPTAVLLQAKGRGPRQAVWSQPAWALDSKLVPTSLSTSS